jgi:uncharacterized membrane protein
MEITIYNENNIIGFVKELNKNEFMIRLLKENSPWCGPFFTLRVAKVHLLSRYQYLHKKETESISVNFGEEVYRRETTLKS